MTTTYTEEHLFTAHTSARLTFVMGIVMGMALMTITGITFFVYVFSGGEINSYAIAPIDTDSQILTEPVVIVTEQDKTDIVEAPVNQVVGAVENYEVTLVQYVDYECRFCKKFFPDVLEFTRSHSDTVRLVIKQYPLVQIHPHAKTASLAAYCAAQQSKLVEYSEQLYSKQDSLTDDTIYQTIASELGMNTDEFATCRTAEATTKAVEAEAAEAITAGIQTQPNLLVMHVNGDREIIDGYVNATYLAGRLGY